VTAYVLAQLGETWGHRLPGTWQRPVERALAYLLAAHAAGGGWGYNATVPSDADSTSWAIVALRQFGLPVPDAAYELLRRAQQPDGGIATYPQGSAPGPAWSLSAPDVTAVAFRALNRAPTEETLAVIQRWQAPDGTLPAYWWASSYYTLAAALDWAGDRPGWRPAARAVAGAFEQALQLRCLVRTGSASAQAAAARLIAMQTADGSWPASALLRLTRPEVTAPWACIDAGPLYIDRNAIFTSATALAALASATG
jgi:hypothetical protein